MDDRVQDHVRSGTLGDDQRDMPKQRGAQTKIKGVSEPIYVAG